MLFFDLEWTENQKEARSPTTNSGHNYIILTEVSTVGRRGVEAMLRTLVVVAAMACSIEVREHYLCQKITWRFKRTWQLASHAPESSPIIIPGNWVAGRKNIHMNM